jgi:hypothetical protein
MFKFFNKGERPPIYPIIKFGFRGEDIEYIMETDSINIGFTCSNGRRIYLDFTHWESKRSITKDEKEIILLNCLTYCNKYSFKKTIVVINSDIDKDFWLYVCEKYKSQIRSIEYTSKDDHKQLLLNMFMQQIHLHDKVRIGNIDYFTESEILEYLKTQ